MGTGLFNYIAQACQSLAATTAPTITAMGIHIVIALATIVLVWFGVQEALASAHGGAGFSMGRFLNLFMLLTFAYAMVNYYDTSIPGLGFSIKGFIDGHDQSYERHWVGWFHNHAERDPLGILENRPIDAEQRHVSV